MPVVGMSNDRAIDLAVDEVRRMAGVCEGADPSTPVPSCPEWDLAELQRHVGRVHRWAATMVEQRSQERLGREGMNWAVPDDPTKLPNWVAEGADFVEPRFRAADPDAEMWAWGWPKRAVFWPRRMVHETAIHRADAQLALGVPAVVDLEIAVDGIGELLDNLPHALYFAPKVAELRGDGQTITLVATDAVTSWCIELTPDGFTWKPNADGGDVTMTATASELYLALYRRTPTHGVTGNAALLEKWLTNSAL